MSRQLNASNPEDAVWVSCPECDSLPGDLCKLDPEMVGRPGFDKVVHQARIRSMQDLVALEATGKRLSSSIASYNTL